jgi:hypothetical protein
LFIELAKKLNKTNGLCSYIIPSAWTSSVYNKKLRMFLLESTILKKLVITQPKTFADATVETLILLFQNNINTKEVNITIKRWDKASEESYDISTEKIKQKENVEFNVYSNPITAKIIEKLDKNTSTLKDIAEVVWGVKVYEKGKGIPPQDSSFSKDKVFHCSKKTKETELPLLGGKNIFRYSLDWQGQYLNYGKWIAAPRDENWFKTSTPRIVVREITSNGQIHATLIESPYVFSNSIDGIRIKSDFNINPNYLLALINSKLLSFYHYKTSPNSNKGAFPKLLLKDLREFPIKVITPKEQNLYKIKVETIIALNKTKQKMNKEFIGFLKSVLNISKTTGIIQKWYEQEYKDFRKVFINSDVELSISKEAEWMQYFNEQKQKVQELHSEIEKTDRRNRPNGL